LGEFKANPGIRNDAVWNHFKPLIYPGNETNGVDVPINYVVTIFSSSFNIILTFNFTLVLSSLLSK